MQVRGLCVSGLAVRRKSWAMQAVPRDFRKSSPIPTCPNSRSVLSNQRKDEKTRRPIEAKRNRSEDGEYCMLRKHRSKHAEYQSVHCTRVCSGREKKDGVISACLRMCLGSVDGAEADRFSTIPGNYSRYVVKRRKAVLYDVVFGKCVYLP